ncbi:MAG: hypothetical protein RBR22_09275 [Desulfuromonas sp.]|nr:hypothetical protein [Desulfuromonas sp.]
MSKVRCELLNCQVGDADIQSDAGANGAITTVRQRYCLPPDFIGFSGHFPGYPIVPAVVQVFMAQLVAEQHLSMRLPLSSVERAKFHRQLQPLDIIDVQCQRKEVHGRGVVDVQLYVADDHVASFWLVENSGATKG